MLLTFGDCELDTNMFTLRCAGQVRPVEPLVFNLLAYLVQHRERIVSRQELLDALWRGKVVSESALSSCVKAARHAVGDDGEAQRCIATIQGRGYRFIAPVQEPSPAVLSALDGLMPPDPNPGQRPQRASVAVMPFADLAPASETRGGTADALAHDIITRLAQLRSLFVIAQGTVFALSERNIDPRAAGLLLKVDYIVSGTVRQHDHRLTVTTELTETVTARIIWTEMFDSPVDDTLAVLDEIGSKIVAHIASEIETSERNRAMLQAPNGLDAWAAHHRGLWHMYRFTPDDNEQARSLFAMAVRLDPTFARAYAGLSFTHFQNAFQGWGGERALEIDRAFAAAGQSLFADQRNPAAHWAMGRALWLRGQHEPSVAALEQAVALSPSFALGHYTLGFVQAQAGDPLAAITATDYSRLLSPYDPLLFGILGSRAIALVRLGRFDEAATCAVQAAACPNAHAHILGIAAYSLALTGDLDAARAQADAIRLRIADYKVGHFLAAFHLDDQGTALFRQGAQRVGMA